MEGLTLKKEIVSTFLKHNILVSREVLTKLNEPGIAEQWYGALQSGTRPAELLIKKLSVQEAPETTIPPAVRIVWEYQDLVKKRNVQDFVDYFNMRYKAIQRMLASRQELTNLTSIARLKGKKDREEVSIIGMISEKGTTKNEHIVLTVEDTTSIIKILISKNNKELYETGRDLVYDEVIGINGTLGDGIVFAKSVTFPDIPLGELKRAPEEAYAAVLSCVHVGSAGFEKERFENFTNWCHGNFGTPEQRAFAQKLRYIFICGDVVDGVGIYPSQEKELSIPDIREQYKEAARLFSKLPAHLPLIICPGNHDVGRISEPQPKLSKDYARPLWELPNAIMVCNPCIVNIHASEHFSGLDVLMYHGYSFDDYAEIVPSIKNSGAHISDRAPLVMRFLLQRRHLAPQHTSTLYIPDPRSDPLVIEKVPDLFFAGHIHKSGTINYRTVTTVSASCFQAKTDFQEKVGHDPDPGVVPVVNLLSRAVTLLRF